MHVFIKASIILAFLCPIPGVFAQKKALTPSSCIEWKQIDSQDISADGRWVTYRMRQADSAWIYLCDTRQHTTRLIPDAENAFFCGKGRWLYYHTPDSVFLVNPGNGTRLAWDAGSAFEMPEGTEWIYRSYTVASGPDSSYTRLVFYILEKQDSVFMERI